MASLDPPSFSGRTGAVAQWFWPHLHAAVRKARFRWTSRRAQTTDFVATVEGEARARGISRERVEHWRQTLAPELVEQVNLGEMNGALFSYGLLDPDYWTNALDIATPGAERRWRIMTQVLDEIVMRTRRRGIPVAVAYAPAAFQYDSTYARCPAGQVCAFPGVTIRKEWSAEPTEVERRLAWWSARMKVPFLDLTPAYRRAAPASALHFALDGHWTPEGHRLAARELGRWLDSTHALPLAAPRR